MPGADRPSPDDAPQAPRRGRNRLAELQLKILWEEILARIPAIEVVGEPKRVRSTFVHGFTELPVRIPG